MIQNPERIINTAFLYQDNSDEPLEFELGVSTFGVKNIFYSITYRKNMYKIKVVKLFNITVLTEVEEEKNAL